MKDSLNTLKELASSVRNATKEGENSAERIGRLFEGILEYIKTPESIENYFELKQDGNGLDYIYTKYNIASAGALSMYASDKINIPSIYDGLPIDNDTIYWHEVDGSKVLKAKGGGGEAGSVQWDNISGKPSWIEDTKPSYSWSDITGEKPFYTKEEIASKYVTIDTEQEITALKHFTAGLSVGESKKKIYEENGVVYIDADVAVTGGMTFYATGGRTVSTIMDAVAVDGITIKKENNVLKAVVGAGSSFDENAMWSALSGSSDNQINKSHLTTALDGYASQNWVIENYATKSELSAVSNKLNDFLEGSDTDSIINKWKELEAFLSGMAETDNLAEILETKADKKYVDSTFVTLATKQTITGEKTFSSVLNTAAIKASGEITTPSLAASDYVTIAGIKLRKLEDGALMLEGNLALTGALTMYASNGQSFDTIYDGLPIDNDTIYWQEVDGSRVLKAREGSGSSFDKSAMWTALAGSTTEQINKSHLTTALTGYATKSWVSGKNYAVKATTLAGYGITDAPTKTGSGASGTWGINISGNASNADKLDNYHESDFFRINRGTVNSTEDSSLYRLNGTIVDTSTTGWNGMYAGFCSIGSASALVFRVLGGGQGMNKICMNYSIDGSRWGDAWRIIATTDSNVNSATQLLNKRNIWGQPFNGTADVTGTIVAYNGIQLPYGKQIQTEYGTLLTSGYNLESGYNDFFQLTAVGANKIAKSLVGGNSGRLVWEGNQFIMSAYGGGWYMSDSNSIRSYQDKTVYIGSGSYVNAGGNAYSNNLGNISEPNNCRYVSETTYGIPTGYIHPFCGWSDSAASGWITSYVIGSIRNYANNWGEMYFGIYQYEGASRAWKAYMALDGANRHLYIDGNLMVTGGGTFYGSDIRYKSIVQQIKLSLLDIAKAPSFVYRWNKKEMICDRLNIGGSAQYTQTILPWAVEEKNNLFTMDYATVAYTFAVHTARHLLTYESRTDKKIKKLEREIVILKKQLKKLGYEEVRTLDDSSI